MGLLDIICCGRRSKDEPEPAAEPLLAAPSIASQDGYGAVAMSSGGKEDTNAAGLSTSARKRIDQIGREVGNHMLPISQTRTRGPSTQRAPSPSGSASEPSRPPTPSPRRPAPGSGVLNPQDDEEEAESSAEGGSTANADGVVHKSLFPGGSRGGGKKRGAKPARGRGRGRSKKAK